MSYKNRSGSRVLLPFGLDYSDVLSPGQTTEGPKIELPVHGPLSAYEETCAKQALAVTKLLFNGPFYAGSMDAEAKKSAAETIERYSDKYKTVKKVGRTVDEYPYQLELFPEELYSVMGISNKKKKLLLSSFQADGGLSQYELPLDAETAQLMLDKLKNLAEDLDAQPAQDEVEEEEDFDDAFEEDDDDDYNAEKYFDDGDDDMADDGDDEAAF